MATKEKNFWILLIFLLSGLVIGGLLGEIASKVPGLWWFSYGNTYGLQTPLQLDLDILHISFSCSFKITVASILGLAIGVFAYSKL